jgi:hypothetical protein
LIDEMHLQEVLMKLASTLLLLCLVPLSVGAQELASVRSPEYNTRVGNGIYDLAVRVDGEAILYVKETNIRYLLLSGQPLQNIGSSYTQPLPHAAFGVFNMEKLAGRGTVTLVETPTSGNNFTAVVRINDDKAGADIYRVRLSWTWNPSNPTRPPVGYEGTGALARGPNDRYDDRNGRPDDRFDPRNDRNDRGSDIRNRYGVFEFAGKVDGTTILRIHADQVRIENVAGQAMRNQSFKFSDPLPTDDLREISITESDGRGKIELVEKPWSGNRYTAVIRITDDSPGAGQYNFKLAWRR